MRHRLDCGRRFVLLSLIVSLSLFVGGAPANATPAPFTGAVERIRAYLDQRAEHTGFSANVLVASGDRILVREARGMAERELGVPLRPEHILPIGSLTKPITAVAALRMAERGEIDLDAPICRYLPSCPKEWADVTVEHLMTHTSGIPDLFSDVECAPVAETAAEIARTIEAADVALEAAPGAAYSYNNFGYVLLAWVMERASGGLWEDLLYREVFEPAGMSDTRYDDVWAIVEGRARGYEVEEGRLLNVEYEDHCAYAAGGLHSTVDDLWHFLDAVHRGALVPERFRETAFEPHAGGYYGYGWAMRRPFGRPVRIHSGGIAGFSSAFAHLPDDDLTIVVLSNLQEENGNGTVCDLAALALDAAWRPLGSFDAAPPSAAELERYVGTYPPDGAAPDDGEEIVVSESAGALRYARRGSSRSRKLVRVEGSLFALESAEHVRIRFHDGGEGSPGLTVERCGEPEIEAHRG